jgi:TRAP-type C4-dicarboxylate transport system substrate-binding protein
MRVPDDFKGITYRVMTGQIFTDMFQALGASTATIAFAELYTALEQGIVHGEDLGASMHLDYKFNEVCPYSTEFNMTATFNNLLFSNKAWGMLSEDEKQIIYKAAEVAEKASYDYVKTSADNYYRRLIEAGSTVVRYSDLTEEELALCWAAVEPLWGKYEGIVGTDIYNIMLSYCPYYK